MTRVVMVVLLLACAVTAASAQELDANEPTALAQAVPPATTARPAAPPQRPTAPPPRPAQPAPVAPATTTPQPPQASRPAPTESAASQQNDPINVRYEITLRDEGGPLPQTKTVTLLTTLGDVSSVRVNVNPGPSQLNVDAWPMGYRDGRVRTRISIEYNPPNPDTPQSPVSSISIRETVFVWLEGGKPLVVSQSADPRSDRRLTVEVTATILE